MLTRRAPITLIVIPLRDCANIKTKLPCVLFFEAGTGFWCRYRPAPAATSSNFKKNIPVWAIRFDTLTEVRMHVKAYK